MLRSLFAGISGLRVNQVMLDVTGNNIANANTIGFKSSRTVFSDTLSQMLTSGSSANGTRGGTNPIQIGLGVQVAGTNTNFLQGSNQTTGGATDMMIQGDGFFVVKDGGATQYTRAGAFSFDSQANLVTPTGALVQGYRLDSDGEPVDGDIGDPDALNSISLDNETLQDQLGLDSSMELTSYSIGSDGVVTGTFSDGETEETYSIARIALANFSNPMGLDKAGDTSYTASANSGAAEIGVPGEQGEGDLVVGSVEMSNVDLAAEFTNLILAQRGFQASSRVITTSDSVLEDLVNIKR
ncbi:flagellar hook-basal body complex protein [Nocardioides mangrovi]|uniref:Flagellar hook protein FlgE n=1 Tax=Nocardioides mangrovi TaxID=2874580 RepID=A0ABS7UAV4_9ACTN|nr:flagellar hook-basal body complex protein [Nocardioides mangrovi]MBZ5737818.1 flagellar hook-basal body complex protein [Nocardioides mangrovi]